MNEESQLDLNNQKNTDIKTAFFNNKKSIIFTFVIILILLFSYFFYLDHKKSLKIQISEKYNSAVIEFNSSEANSSIFEMKNIIETKDPTYAPLALYFLLDNNLINKKKIINEYFDILINETDLDKEVRNLIIYKKGLYNSEYVTEEELLNIFKPLINRENTWKSHSLYVIAEYFFAKNEKQKSKEFFDKILEMENPNPKIKFEAQKRLQRDFSG